MASSYFYFRRLGIKQVLTLFRKSPIESVLLSLGMKENKQNEKCCATFDFASFMLLT